MDITSGDGLYLLPMALNRTTLEDLTRWANLLKKTRTFFDGQGFLEVGTDALVPVGAFESSIDSLTVQWASGSAELHTSPEIEMKRVLSRLACPIYQVCKVYRDDPPTEIHRREFTMLEWYQPGISIGTLQETTRRYLQTVSEGRITFGELTVSEAILKHAGIEIDHFRTKDELRAEIEQKRVIALSPDDEWSDMFFKLLIEKVEPALNPKVATLLTGYPAELSPLSEIDPTTGRAARFEIYWHGMELCNGCVELQNVDELRRRYGCESESRRRRGKPPHPFPERLALAMERMPKSAGVAVGLDRLFAALYSS